MNFGVPEGLRHPIVLRVARLATGCVFLAAALGKLGDLTSFALQVHHFRLAPVWSEHLIAMLLPWVELIAGLALVLGIRARAGALTAVMLMVVFTIGVGSAWARGLNFECGCFGNALASKVGSKKFIENLGLTLLALWASIPRRDP